MDTIQNLTGTRWRKSSYSAEGNCVEVAVRPSLVAVRDSKNPEGPVFAVRPAAFEAFVRAVSV
ncbi:MULTISPECIES: DUF397 domain-containing protein [Streptomyces]|uniref:DUF397 domain-containing protein n=1 Tax=Streptomyces TaxID=1883 RepID=UPI00099DFADC|nr:MULTISPECIES: DUF397 domain-containing protein [unclassified Streptomyces]